MRHPRNRSWSAGRLVKRLSEGSPTNVVRQPDKQVTHIDPCAVKEKQTLNHTNRANERQPEQHPNQRSALLNQA